MKLGDKVMDRLTGTGDLELERKQKQIRRRSSYKLWSSHAAFFAAKPTVREALWYIHKILNDHNAYNYHANYSREALELLTEDRKL